MDTPLPFSLVQYATPEANDWYIPSSLPPTNSDAQDAQDDGPDDSIKEPPDIAKKYEHWRENYAHLVMPPPPPKIYPSRQDLLDDTKAFAKLNGYQLMIKHSRSDAKGVPSTLWMQCELGGTYRNRHKLRPEDRKRKRASRKTDCPFEVIGKKKRWSNAWVLILKKPEHNHDLIKDPNQAILPPEYYPDLEAAVFNWHQDAISKGENPHGILVKNKANELFAQMPQYQGMTPRIDKDWLHAYRERWGFRDPIASRRQLPRDLYGWVPPHAEPVTGPFQDVDAVFPAPIHSGLFVAIRQYVEQYMSRFDSSHDYQHILRVLGLSKLILRQEHMRYPDMQYDIKAVFLAAMLHDVGDRKYVQPGEDPEHQIAELLLAHGATAELALKVQTIVKNVSYSNETKAPRMVQAVLQNYPELGIVQDADRLDAIGAVGIARTFAFGGAKAPERGLQGCVDHFGDKLERLEAMMKTETGRELAQERTLRLQVFKQWWIDEQAVLS